VDASGKERGRVLVVDDEEALRLSLVAILEDEFDVVEAATLAEGRRRIDTESFDVLVSDFQLPDGRGDALIRHCAERAPATQRILLTGHSDYAAVRELQRSGSVLVIFKPTDPAQVLGWVRNSVALARVQKGMSRLRERTAARAAEGSAASKSDTRRQTRPSANAG
jgi:DNA-binding NtrC family response regulator